MVPIKIISFALSAAFIAVSPVQAQEFLPISRTKILGYFSPEKFEPISISAKNAPADVQRLQAEGDTVWVLYDKAGQTRIAMAGRGDQVHSLRILVAVVNNSQEKNKQVMASLSALFSAIYPNWPQAKDWPMQSPSSSWSATAREMNPKTRLGVSPGNGVDDLIPSKQIGGITASTFGVPPDLIVYAITTRDACIPKRPVGKTLPQDDPTQRLVC